MLGAIRGDWGHQGCRGVKGVWGAGREYRYSRARMGIGGIRGHWGLLGGVMGVGSH